MALGFDVYEDNRSFEQQGLTHNVSRYALEKMSFPCLVIESTEDCPVETYKIVVLKNMASTAGSYTGDTISMYYAQDSKMVSLCKISSVQIKSVLKLFENNKIRGYLTKDKELLGDYIYVLSN